MFTISIEKECGCFKKSCIQNHQKFSDKDAALMEAMRLADEMKKPGAKNTNSASWKKGPLSPSPSTNANKTADVAAADTATDF